jgi:hypothetical protein
MSWAALSHDLQGAGFGQAASDRAAQRAFANWRGLFMRKDVNDIGIIPFPANPSNSIDIICNQGAALTRDTILNRWNEQFWNYATVGKNYVYARGTSINVPIAVTQSQGASPLPRAAMYYSEAGFNIPPTSWHQCTTLSGKVSMPIENTPVNPGDRWVCSTKDPFIFQPPDTGHYCLIAVVETLFFANDPTNIVPGSNWDSWSWLVSNGAAAWHNIDVQRDRVTRLKFYNLDHSSERFVFEARCDKLPAGSTVSLYCDDQKLDGQIATNPIKIQRRHQVVRVEAVLPAGHSGTLEVRVETPDGHLLPEGASVEVAMLWGLPHGHPQYAQASARLGAVQSALTAQPLLLSMGNFTILGKAR